MRLRDQGIIADIMKNTAPNVFAEYVKPRIHRNRKKHLSKAQQREYVEEHSKELHHKDAVPYKRVKAQEMEEDVDNSWYAVFGRHGKWWWTDLDNPLRTEEGPYDTEQEAHTAALHYGQEWSA